MNRRRDLIVANLAALFLLFVVLLLGWWQEAAFGLAVLLFLDLFVALRNRQARSSRGLEGEDEGSTPDAGEEMSEDWPGFRYQEAREAHEGGHKLHLGDRIYLVRPVPRAVDEGLVLWVTDERTRGEHGWLLFPDGRTEAK